MVGPISKTQFQVLKFLTDLFTKLKIKYYIDDGLAAIIYGSKRKLYDIDVCIEGKAMNKLKVVFNDLALRPYSYRKFDDCHLYLATLKINSVPVDIAIEKNAYVCRERTRRKFCIPLHLGFKNTRVVNFKGLKLRVTNPEDLFVMKLFVNRKCDVSDAKAMLRHAKMNRNKILRLAENFGIWDKVKRLMK